MANKILEKFLKLSEPQKAPELSRPFLNLHSKETGSSGTKIFSGYASEEYLQTLRGRQRADIFDQMRRGDTQIKMCLSAVKNPIKSATWEVEPADDSEEAKADADLVRHILFSAMEVPFEKFISEALTLVDFGYSLFEVVDKVGDDETFGQFVGIKKLAWRSQRTVERWNKDTETGELKTVSQYAYGDNQKTVDIPAEFLMLFNVDQEGDNFEGISLIRPCYGAWRRKDTYLKLNAVGIEKFAVPTPLAEVPSGKENTPDFGMLVDALEAYTSHQKGYLVFPAGWKVTLEGNTYDPSKVEASVDGEDKRIAKAFLANFLELGMSGGGGSYALGTDLSDFFLSGLIQIANEISGPINQKLIPRLVRLNRGERKAYPKLKHSGIDDKAGKELAEVLKLLTDAKILVPDDQLETNVRKRYGLPKASSEGQRQVTPAPAQAVPTTLSERVKSLIERRRNQSHGE